MPLFTVIGLAADNQMRYAACVEAPSPAAAEERARAEVRASSDTTLHVAAVLAGEVTPVA